MNPSPQTRLALLGTMSDLHNQPIAYDLDCLGKVVTDLAPDLLCAEITLEAWEREDFSRTSIEIREALVPVIASTDTVLIPIAPSLEHYADFTPDSGWRRRLVRSFDRLLQWGQVQADNVQTINGLWFSTYCHTVCWVTEKFWNENGRAAWEKQNVELVENIVRAVERDSAHRVLVAVQCQRLHHIIPLLRSHENLLQIVEYQAL